MRKKYIKPEIYRVALDNTVTLQMMSVPPIDPPPRTGGSKGNDKPFQNPFGDKPFS